MAILNVIGTYLEGSSITLICLLILLYLIYLKISYAGTPPGPWGMPIFGHLYLFSKKPHIDILKMSKKYGDVFSINIGTRRAVILNGYDVIKEALVKKGDIYNGKPVDGMAAHLGDYISLFVTDGEHSKQQRRFILSSLRDFGFGKRLIEERIQEEAKVVIEEFLSHKGRPLDVRDTLGRTVSNVISYLVFGKRFQNEDEEFLKNLNLIGDAVSSESMFTIFDAFHFLIKIIPGSLSGVDYFEKVKQVLYNFTDKQIEEHRKTFDENNIRDIIDVYLMKMKQVEENEANVNGTIFAENYLRANAVMLFIAGTDTTTVTLSWALKILAIHRNVQTRIQKEIDNVIGRERHPIMNDRQKMPYTDATLLELDRFITLLPLTLYHRITEDTTLKGFRIPKNTFIIANLWSVHYDESLWKDPYEFNPERFLEGNEINSKLREYVIPFSIGKRSCLGESLAKMETFILLTSVLQKLTLLPTDRNLETIAEEPLRKLKSICLSIIPRE